MLQLRMNIRTLLKARLRLIENLYHPAWAAGDLKVYKHYSDVWMREYTAYLNKTGRYA